MTSITSLGLGSGLDLEGLIAQLVAAEGTPETLRLTQKEAVYQAELSALGSFRSALATFSQALDALNDLQSFHKRLTTSSNEELFTVTATETAVATSHDVEVIALAQAHKLSSQPFVNGAEDFVGTGNLTIAVGSTAMTLKIDSDNGTLAGIRDAINGAENNPGVTASIVTGEDGAHLVLTSTETGAENAITVSTDGGDGGLAVFAYDPDGTMNMGEVQAATDAELRIDGILVHSASNSVSDTVDGVTIKLLSASPGETARLNVEIDVAGVRDAIENFVFTYNSLQSTLSNLTSYDPTTKIGGPLLGDSMVLLFQDQLRREVGESVSKFTFDFDSLVDLGITTNLEDGTLEIDDAELDAQLSANFDRVADLFAGENGYATRLQALADTYLETDGFIEVRNDGIQKSIEGIEADLLQLNEHLASYDARLRRQFTALDTLVGQLTATSEFLAQQLALLPGFETKAAS